MRKNMLKYFLAGTMFVVGPLAIAQVLQLFKGGANSSLSWTAPTLNADGTPLTDLAGYVVGVFDLAVDTTLPDPPALYTVSIAGVSVPMVDVLSGGGLQAGTYLFAVRAVDEHGNMSVWSDFIQGDIKVVAPGKVGGLQLNK